MALRHFPSTLSAEASNEAADRYAAGFDERGWGLWVAELLEDGSFAGFIGLNPAAHVLPVAPAIEVGWRLAPRFWGRGLASEGARAALALGFQQVGLPEIISFTTEQNIQSRRVMEKLGMRHDPGSDFDDGRFSDWSERRLVVYRLPNPGPRADLEAGR